MPSYANGERTKKAIIEAGKELFYTNGYSKTRCNGIAKKANVKPGLIHYHFATKGTIALEIYTEFLNSAIIETRKIFPNESAVLLNAIQTRLQWYLINTYKEFQRFWYEISEDRVSYELSSGAGVDYYREIDEEIHTGFSQDKLTVLAYAFMGAETEIIIRYLQGGLDLSLEDLIDLDIRTQFQMLGVSQEKSDQVIAESKEEFEKLSIAVKPYFKLRIERR